MYFPYPFCNVPFFNVHTIGFQKIERLQLRKTASSIISSRRNLDVNTVRDSFVYDEENYKITDRKHNVSYTMGDTLKVIVTGASYDRMEIEVVPFSEEEKMDE